MKYKGIFILCLLLLVGCTQPSNKQAAHVVDSLGREMIFEEVPEKVVVLSSSWGEMWQLAGGTISGATEDAKKDKRLKLDESIVDVGTIKNPNLEVVLSLKPDLVIMSDDIQSHRMIASSLADMDINAYVAKVKTFDDYLKVLGDFTNITQRQDNYIKYGESVKQEIDNLMKKMPDTKTEKSALFLRAFSTGVKAKARDHVVCDILEDLGVRNIARTDGFPLEDISVEAIMKENPDYIFVVFMGDEAKAKATLKTSIQSSPAWQSLSAVKNDQVIILSKELYHYKPNARWAEAYETLFQIIYPESI